MGGRGVPANPSQLESQQLFLETWWFISLLSKQNPFLILPTVSVYSLRKLSFYPVKAKQIKNSKNNQQLQN